MPLGIKIEQEWWILNFLVPAMPGYEFEAELVFIQP